jgi:hypothetical protein
LHVSKNICKLVLKKNRETIMKFKIRKIDIAVLFSMALLFSGCAVFRGITPFQTKSDYRRPVEKLGSGRIAAVFDNRLSQYQFYDDGLLTDELDKVISRKFGQEYLTVGQTYRILADSDLADIIADIHFYDNSILYSKKKELEMLRKTLGAHYLLILKANEDYEKFRYDYGAVYGGFTIGTYAGYGRSILVSLTLVDLDQYKVLWNRTGSRIIHLDQRPDYDRFISSFAGDVKNYLEDIQ